METLEIMKKTRHKSGMSGKRTYTFDDSEISNFSHKIAKSLAKGIKRRVVVDHDEEVTVREYLMYLIAKDLKEGGFDGPDPESFLEDCKNKQR